MYLCIVVQRNTAKPLAGLVSLWIIGNKKPLKAATFRGGANAKRSQYLRRYGHKDSVFIRINERKGG